MPVQMVRNNQEGPTVFSPDDNAKHYIMWQGKDDPTGGDIQPVGEDVQQNTQYQKMLRRGVLEIVEADDLAVIEAMEKQQTDWEYRQGASAREAEAAIEHTANNDIVVLACVGPSPRGAGTKCGQDVTVKDSKRNDGPPLCGLHIALKSEFVPGEETISDGKLTKSWTRVTMGARERSQ